MNTTSKHAIVAVLALALALSTGACATEVDTETADTLWVEGTEVVSKLGVRSTELVGLSLSDDPVVIDSSACACTNGACVEAFIRENLGCDLCVHIACASDGFVGGCVRCEP
jgi:hypothetical protein